MESWLDFEKPLLELEKQIRDLKSLADAGHPEIAEQVEKLERIAEKKRHETYEKLTRWERVQLARHPLRPYAKDYIAMVTSQFTELHGDRLFADDKAMIGGLGVIDGRKVIIIGQQKGRDTKENLVRNFGMSHPEGYRKALRLMKQAERFKMPIVTLIDTPGAYPGIGAEERGQGEAIATNLMEMARLKTPIISFVIGEGGSGGALALSVADRLYMLEHSVYSVISPEGCAAILWRKSGELTTEDFARAAAALKLTAGDLKEFKLIDDIIPEPMGGAHREPEAAARKITEYIVKAVETLQSKSPAKLLDERYKKIRKIGSPVQVPSS